MKLGIIVRSDNTGLGNQTKDLTTMLNPSRVMHINSYSFNRNKQHPEWYDAYDCVHSRGFPRRNEIDMFLKGLDVVLTCETFYDKTFIDLAKRRGVKTVLQYNYEFLEHLTNPSLSLPDVMASPSVWNINKIIDLYGDKTKVIHLPPPIDTDLFTSVRENNMSQTHKKILHIGGKAASKDRNGTQTVIDMLKYSKADYSLVIQTQTEININSKDSRLIINTDNVESRSAMYDGYDAMVLPRRYAGLCLPMNEALVSGLPVFMTNISPNNYVLPGKWLVDSTKIDQLKTRDMLDVYEADPRKLAKIIDNYMNNKKKHLEKQEALEIGINNFSMNKLRDKYLEVLGA